MKVEHSDSHTFDVLDDAGMAFMALTAHRLNGALERNGIANAEQRQQICTDFLFEFAYQHDAGWLISQDRKLFPKVIFVGREKPAADENLGAITELHVPTQATSWHEFVHGVVAQYFEDDGETVPDLQTGSYETAD